MDEKKAVLEAALFVSEDPIDTDTIADIMNLGSKGYVQTIVDDLRDDLAEDDRGLELIETENGYQMQVKNDYIRQVKDLAPHQDLAEATLRTLSLIAYNAPVKQSKIIKIRGNRAYNQIKELEERGLIDSHKDGRTKILEVTDDFLDYFGLDSIDEFRQGVGAEPASAIIDDEPEDEEREETEAEEEKDPAASDGDDRE